MSAVERRRHVLETPGLVHVELCAADETTAAAAAAALAQLWPASACWPPRRIPGEDGVVVDLVADPAPHVRAHPYTRIQRATAALAREPGGETTRSAETV